MSINEDKLKKAKELEEKYGSDMDDIMFMEDNEFRLAYQSEPDIFGNYGYYFDEIKLTKEEFGKLHNKVLDYLTYISSVDLNSFSEEDIRCQSNIFEIMLSKLETLKINARLEIESLKDLILGSKDYMARKDLAEDLRIEEIITSKINNTIAMVRLLNEKLKNTFERSR